MLFFYLELCPSCESYRKAEMLASRVLSLGREQRRIEAIAYSMFHPKSEEVMATMLTERGWEEAIGLVPLLITPDAYYGNYDDIELILDTFKKGKR